MERVVVTVEALRCWQCQKLMHPSEPFFRRQMMTAVEKGSRVGEVRRYERVNVCSDCQAFFEQVEAEERNRIWWRWVWVGAVLAGWLVPYGYVPFWAAVIWRNVWKWQHKRRAKIAPGQADRKEVPQATATSDPTTGRTKDGSA